MNSIQLCAFAVQNTFSYKIFHCKWTEKLKKNTYHNNCLALQNVQPFRSVWQRFPAKILISDLNKIKRVNFSPNKRPKLILSTINTQRALSSSLIKFISPRTCLDALLTPLSSPLSFCDRVPSSCIPLYANLAFLKLIQLAFLTTGFIIRRQENKKYDPAISIITTHSCSIFSNHQLSHSLVFSPARDTFVSPGKPISRWSC